jgi:hypothetical protein
VSNDEEVDFDKAKPVKLVAEVNPEKTVKFFAGEEQSKLQPKEITEELLARLYDNMQEAEMLAKLIEQDKKDVKELGRGSETIIKGKYIATFKTVKGRKSFNFEKYVKDKIGAISEAEEEQYSDVGEPSVRLEIRKAD